MIIQAKVSFGQYVKLLYTLTYRRPIMFFIVFVGLVMLGWIIGYQAGVSWIARPAYYQYLTLGLIAVVQPLVIYSTVWRNYYSSNHLRESLQMDLTPALIKIKGESFYTELKWNRIFKVVELESWFLVYQNNLSAILIPKTSLPGELETEFEQILRSIPGLDLHLKK